MWVDRNCMYWFPLHFQLPIVIWPVQCWKRRKTPNKYINVGSDVRKVDLSAALRQSPNVSSVTYELFLFGDSSRKWKHSYKMLLIVLSSTISPPKGEHRHKVQVKIINSNRAVTFEVKSFGIFKRFCLTVRAKELKDQDKQVINISCHSFCLRSKDQHTSHYYHKEHANHHIYANRRERFLLLLPIAEPCIWMEWCCIWKNLFQISIHYQETNKSSEIWSHGQAATVITTVKATICFRLVAESRDPNHYWIITSVVKPSALLRSHY